MKKEILSLANTVKDVTQGYISTGIILNKDPGTRISICISCDQYKGSRCQKCGCFVSVKAKFEFARCPIGRW